MADDGPEDDEDDKTDPREVENPDFTDEDIEIVEAVLDRIGREE
jgi:hypothetical protein